MVKWNKDGYNTDKKKSTIKSITSYSTQVLNTVEKFPS